MGFLKSAAVLAALSSVALAPAAMASDAAAVAPEPAAKAVTAKAPITNVRKGSTLKKRERAANEALIGGLATVAVVGGAIILTDNDDGPSSP